MALTRVNLPAEGKWDRVVIDLCNKRALATARRSFEPKKCFLVANESRHAAADVRVTCQRRFPTSIGGSSMASSPRRSVIQ